MRTPDNTPHLPREWDAICSWLDASPVPTLLVSPLRILHANSAAASFFNLPQQELAGGMAHDVVAPALRGSFEQFLNGAERPSSARFDIIGGEGVIGADVQAWPIVCNDRTVVEVTFQPVMMDHAQALIRSDRAILEEVLSGAPMSQALEALLRETEAHSDKGMLCSVLLVDETGTHLMHGAAPSLPAAYSNAIHGLSIGASSGSCGTAAYRRERVMVPDIASDPLWAEYRDLAQQHNLAACFSTPMVSSRGELLGTVAMYYRSPGDPSQHDLELIDRAARLAAVVVERQRAEDALRETKNRLELTLAGTEVGTWVLDLDEHTVTADANLARMFHVLPQDATGRPLELYLEAVHPEDRPLVESAIADALQTEEGNYEVDYRLVHPGAPVRWVTARGRLERDARGRAIRFAGILIDITARKRVEERTREVEMSSERRFRAAIKAVSDIVWTNDSAGRMVGPQPDWQDFTGQSQEEAQGYGWSAAVHPDDAQPTLRSWQRYVSELQEHPEREWSFEHRVRRFDAQFRRCSIRAVPVRDESGKLLEFVGVHTDITDTRARERDLRQQAMLLETAQMAGDAGFWRWNLSTDAVSWTAGSYRLFGWLPGDPVSMDRVWTVVHKEDRTVIEEALKRARRTGVYYAEFRILRSDGTARWVAARARYIREGGDELLVGVNLDVTDKKLAEDALVKSEKIAAVGRLASSISHEINNPLEAVTNLLYLAETTPSFDESRSYVKSAQHELQRVTEIVTQTLRFHRQSTKPRQTRMSELTGSVLALYRNKITHSGIRLRTSYSDDLPVLCFEGEIRQVLANIIGNAIDAMPAGGMLLVRLHRAQMRSEQPGMRVTVADSGAGMTPQTRRHLFEPFYTTKGATGTGLGLWVSHEIIRKHQGSIHVKSSRSATQHGSTFCVFLPLQPAL